MKIIVLGTGSIRKVIHSTAQDSQKALIINLIKLKGDLGSLSFIKHWGKGYENNVDMKKHKQQQIDFVMHS